MMSAEIANEILHPSEERMRALICIGGNLAVALPDQEKAERALSALELLIVIDPRLTATARLAHYVFAPKLQFERPDHSMSMEAIHPAPFAHVTPALVPLPPDSDLVEDWLPLWSLARSCGLTLEFGGEKLPTDAAPTPEALFAIQTARSEVPFEEVAEQRGGRLFERPLRTVQPARSSERFQLLADDVREEMRALCGEMREAAAPPRRGSHLPSHRAPSPGDQQLHGGRLRGHLAAHAGKPGLSPPGGHGRASVSSRGTPSSWCAAAPGWPRASPPIPVCAGASSPSDTAARAWPPGPGKPPTPSWTGTTRRSRRSTACR